MLCGSRDKGPLFCVRGMMLWKCRGCALIGLDAPVPGAVGGGGETYGEDYFKELLEPGPQEMARHQGIFDAIRRHAKGKRLLDIGIGNGAFLRLCLAAGWEAEGVDVSAFACRHASERIGAKVHHGALREAGLPGASFDAVNMRHCLEHAPDPLGLLQETFRVLKPGGILCVAVPNMAGLHARILGPRWFHLDVPRHLFHFTPKTLARLLRQNGFYIVRLRTQALHSASLALHARDKLRAAAGERLGRAQWLHAVKRCVVASERICMKGLARLGWGEEILVLAAKRGDA